MCNVTESEYAVIVLKLVLDSVSTSPDIVEEAIKEHCGISRYEYTKLLDKALNNISEGKYEDVLKSLIMGTFSSILEVGKSKH